MVGSQAAMLARPILAVELVRRFWRCTPRQLPLIHPITGASCENASIGALVRTSVTGAVRATGPALRAIAATASTGQILTMNR